MTPPLGTARDPREVELKFHLPQGSRAILEKYPALAEATAEHSHLVSTYFDTPDRALDRNGLTLRVRRNGEGRIQNVKSRSDGHGVAAESRRMGVANRPRHSGGGLARKNADTSGGGHRYQGPAPTCIHHQYPPNHASRRRRSRHGHGQARRGSSPWPGPEPAARRSGHSRPGYPFGRVRAHSSSSNARVRSRWKWRDKLRRGPKLLLDRQEPVVLGHPFAAAERAGLDLAPAHTHREIGDEGILGLA